MTQGKIKRKRLTPRQRQDILDNKGKMTGKELAKKHGVALNTIYKTWKKAEAVGVKRGRPPKGAAGKAANPNQNRINFCKRWIDILQAEVKRLENEPDLLKEAEAALVKVIRNQK